MGVEAGAILPRRRVPKANRAIVARGSEHVSVWSERHSADRPSMTFEDGARCHGLEEVAPMLCGEESRYAETRQKDHTHGKHEHQPRTVAAARLQDRAADRAI